MPAPLTGRDPRILAFFMIAGGLGLAGWYGLAWYQLPVRTQAEIEEFTDVRLALELEHRGPLLQPDAEHLQQLRNLIHTELTATYDRQRQEPLRWVGLGLVLCVFGASQWVLSLARRRP